MIFLFKRHMFLILAGLLVFAAVGFAALKALSPAAGPAGGGWGGGEMVTPVIAPPVGLREFASRTQAVGTAQANESVVITSKVTDVIRRIRFESGDAVKRGDILVELASVEQSADLDEARAARADAKREADRFADLASRGVAPRARAEETQVAYQRAQSRVDALESRIADRVIRAPFDGVLGLRTASPGTLARPGDGIVTLDDVSIIKVDFALPERDVSLLKVGETITATAAAFSGETFSGRITEIDSRIDERSRSLTVRAEIDNADGRLKPGMLLMVELKRDSRMALAVPELSVLRREDVAFVYVAEEGEAGRVANMRTVEIGVREAGFVEIVAGLEAGERVVHEGVVRLRPGAMVRFADEAGSGRPGGRPSGRPGGAPASAGASGN